MSGLLRRIVIVGGGTAGWMAAAAFARALQPAIAAGQTSVHLVESDEIGSVGVGEATVPTIRQFNKDIGLDEIEFVRETRATFKLGIEFRDWRSDGAAFFHGFGDHLVDEGPFSTLNHWLRMRQLDPAAAGQLDDYSVAAVLARQCRVCAPVNDPRTPLSHFNYAFHFDAGLYARLLRSRAERDGVQRYEGRIVDVRLRPETGFIDAVQLTDGRELAGDLFIDCSGFAALLIGKTLGAAFVDYGHWLPVDRAWAVPSAPGDGPVTPYTRSTALDAGWQWRIPLQHRTGNGYVFSSAFTSEEAARDKVLANLDTAALAEPRLLKFKTGRRDSFWVRNCVAVGLSSGFIEPLESTSIQLMQNGISRLLTMLPDLDFAPALAVEYNRIQALEFDRIRDFIIAHYALTGRQDTEFWRYISGMSLPDTLVEKIETFRETGLLPMFDQESFVTPSWHAVLVGLGLEPRHIDSLLRSQSVEDVRRTLQARRAGIQQAAAGVADHTEFMRRHRLLVQD